MKRAHQVLTFSAAVGAGLLAASAFAQQPAPTTTPPPAQTQAAPQSAPTSAPPADATQPRAQRGPSAEDRAAYFDARIAAVHAGLRLTPDQERLWPPVETAVRDMAKQMMELRQQRDAQAAPADPVERMARMGDAATKRGQAMSRLADAARPLYASLSDDQKRRLRTLMRVGGRDDERGARMGRDDERGHYGRHHDRMHRGDMRGEMHGMRDGEDRGSRRENDRRGSYWNDWR